MSLFDRMLDLLPMRRVKPWKWPPVVIHGSPALDTEADLAKFLLSRPEVIGFLSEYGVSAPGLLAQLAALQFQDPVMTRETVRQLAAADQTMPANPVVGTYLQLLSLCTDELRTALTPSGQRVGDIAFQVARGCTERSLELQWPSVLSGGSVELLDDAITPLECAASAFQDALGFPYEAAAKLAIRVHQAGAARVSYPPGPSLADHCRAVNAAWRSKGHALYCQPSPKDADT